MEVIPGSPAAPAVRVLGGDSRQPIILSDWIISWQEARDIALAVPGHAVGSNGPSFMLTRSGPTGDAFQWLVRFIEPDGAFYQYIVDAITGKLLSQQRARPQR